MRWVTGGDWWLLAKAWKQTMVEQSRKCRREGDRVVGAEVDPIIHDSGLVDIPR